MCDPVMLCAAGAHGCLGHAEQRVCTSLSTVAAHTCRSNRPYLRAAEDVQFCAVGSLKWAHAVLAGADTDLRLRLLSRKRTAELNGPSFCVMGACDQQRRACSPRPRRAGRAALRPAAQRLRAPLARLPAAPM